jgi:ABC-type antimicrobial peptide transport system permease subunit
LTALTREAFSEEEAQAIRDMSTELISIMRVAAFVIALAVVGLTLYTATLSRIREVGVMRALGATRGRVSATVIDQAVWSVGTAAVVAVTAAFMLSWVLGFLGAVPMTVEPASIVRVAVGAFALGLMGAVLPISRVSKVDPASVYGR